jgi:uridine kinase
VLLLEGVFLLRPTLQPYWDDSLFVQAGFDVTLRRAMQRDLYLFGTAEKTGHRYRTRYIPGQQLYLSQVRPEGLADVIVHNDDPTQPSLTWKARGPQGG